MIRYSCHSENFGILSAEHTFSLIPDLQFDCIDIASRSLIPQNQIQADPAATSAYLKDLSQRYELPLSELFLSEVEVNGEKIRPACASSISESFCHAFRSICQFAQNAGFLSIMGSAGPYDPALSYHDNFLKTSWALNQQVKIASEYGLRFHVEPSRHSLLNTVPNALYMLELVPDLRYTLDFLHYQFSRTPLEESMKLLPYAGHLHARQAQAGIGKCDISKGEINYVPIVNALKKMHWHGDIMLEFWCDDRLSKEGIQAVEQNIVMRYYLKQLFRS